MDWHLGCYQGTFAKGKIVKVIVLHFEVDNDFTPEVDAGCEISNQIVPKEKFFHSPHARKPTKTCQGDSKSVKMCSGFGDGLK